MSVSSIPAIYANSDNQNESKIRRFVTHNVRDISSVQMWRACFAEFIGVFLLCFLTIAGGISEKGQPPASLLQAAFGSGVFISVIITALSTVSGGHVNPAISLGFWITNQISFVRFVFYSLFQMLGSVAGVAALQLVLPSKYKGNLGLLLPDPDVTLPQALVMELIITALLLFAVLAFIDEGREDVRGSIAYQVGLIVMINILAAGKISGAAMNPARALGPAVIVGNMKSHWIYWVGPMAGSLIGAWLYDSIFSTRPIGFMERAIGRTKRREQLRECGDKNGGREEQKMMLEVSANDDDKRKLGSTIN